MPIIKSLTLQNFRNLADISIDFSPKFNVCYGNNGSGKTSLLEAIYYLGHGKSFRASQYTRIIQHHRELFRIIAKITAETPRIIGVERKQDGERCIKLDGDLQNSIVALSRLMPIQFMSPMSYRFFHDGPKLRRQYLDWALFHVEPSFIEVWQRFQRLLKQRNGALKHHQDLSVWDSEFARVATDIDRMRKAIILLLEPICRQQLSIILPAINFSLHYQRGWPAEVELLALLQKNQLRDKQLGYTYYGPQRADFQLSSNGIPIDDILSQGQQKLAAYALHLALGTLLQQTTGTSPIYLIDDLPSELDVNSRTNITQTLELLNAQVFITGIAVNDLKALLQLGHSKLFHVEHGTLAAMTSHHT